MASMLVTPDVSKLSGWLNADAFCRGPREEGIRCGAVCGPGGGGRRATAAHAACRGGLDCRFGVGHGEERTSNMECMLVTPDVSKLSGWLNADASCRPSQRRGIRCGASCGLGGRRRRATRGARSVQGRARLQIGSRAGRGDA